MSGIDVRIRAILLTLLLVGATAIVVEFWPERTPSAIETPVLEPESNDEQIRRHFDWAVTQLRTGHYERAINGFLAVLAQAPAMPEAYLNIGFAQVEQEQYQQAQQSFQTAIDLRPEQVNAYWGLAVSLEGLCDIAGAIGAMRTYVHLAKPDDAYLVKANAALWEWEQMKQTGQSGCEGGTEIKE